jgi:hypothetical protein
VRVKEQPTGQEGRDFFVSLYEKENVKQEEERE